MGQDFMNIEEVEMRLEKVEVFLRGQLSPTATAVDHSKCNQKIEAIKHAVYVLTGVGEENYEKEG